MRLNILLLVKLSFYNNFAHLQCEKCCTLLDILTSSHIYTLVIDILSTNRCFNCPKMLKNIILII